MTTNSVSFDDAQWQRAALAEFDRALKSIGAERADDAETVKSWGRSCIWRAPTTLGLLWVKHGYRLPPGEEVVLERLAARHPGRVPDVVAVWEGGFAMRPLAGRELREGDSLDLWVQASRALGVLAQAERDHVGEWLDLGVRDRRPAAFIVAIDELRESEAVAGLSDEVRAGVLSLLPLWVDRFAEAFRAAPTLVPQDSGCCNLQVTPGGIVAFDWADVVVGHPVFSCDRLLDQVPVLFREAVIGAFCEPLSLSRAELDAVRRSNVLHEVLRYFGELPYLHPSDPVHASLTKSVRNQLEVLVRHEALA